MANHLLTNMIVTDANGVRLHPMVQTERDGTGTTYKSDGTTVVTSFNGSQMKIGPITPINKPSDQPNPACTGGACSTNYKPTPPS
ncbi:MAG TPA: hypothetical protein V6C81_28345 [Planktothrix sp.]|jgi:hypothetical protein